MNTDLDTGHNTSAPAHWGELKDANFTGPNQTSSNSALPQLDVTRAISVGLVLGAFILFAIVGNILVILSVACNRHLRTPTNYFIVNLAIADLLLSFTVLPFSATLEVLGYWVLGRIFCDIWAAVDVLCCTASILSLCAISIDRYIGMRYSLQYPTLVTRRKAILALWHFSVLGSCPRSSPSGLSLDGKKLHPMMTKNAGSQKNPSTPSFPPWAPSTSSPGHLGHVLPGLHRGQEDHQESGGGSHEGNVQLQGADSEDPLQELS